MKRALGDIARHLARAVRRCEPVLVGIDGGAGAGKTTFTRRLERAVARAGRVVSVIHVDDFYRFAADRWAGDMADQPIGHDLDWVRLRDEALDPLGRGRPACYRPFDWPGDRLLDAVTVAPSGVILVEGVFSLRAELTDRYDLRVWLTCPRPLQRARVLERGDMTLDELERWMPGEDAYVAAHAPERSAHVTVDGEAGVWTEGGLDRFRAIHWALPGQEVA